MFRSGWSQLIGRDFDRCSRPAAGAEGRHPRGQARRALRRAAPRLRARAEKADIRVRQARLVRSWIADRISAGENVIVLGDLNTEEPAESFGSDSDLGILCGKDTESAADDLVDLHSYLSQDQQRTHLLPGRAFDRILVSRSLIEDDPNRKDLVFSKVEQRKDLAVRGAGIDDQEAHWNGYWEMDESERDLSDHWPLVARFQWR